MMPETVEKKNEKRLRNVMVERKKKSRMENFRPHWKLTLSFFPLFSRLLVCLLC